MRSLCGLDPQSPLLHDPHIHYAETMQLHASQLAVHVHDRYSEVKLFNCTEFKLPKSVEVWSPTSNSGEFLSYHVVRT